MRTLRRIAFLLMAVGAVLLTVAAFEGDVHVGMFLIVPFVYGTGLLPFAGMALLIAGVVMLMLDVLPTVKFEREPPVEGAPGTVERKGRSGGVVLLGPIPIVWGDAKMRPWMIGVGAAILVLWLLFLILR